MRSLLLHAALLCALALLAGACGAAGGDAPDVASIAEEPAAPNQADDGSGTTDGAGTSGEVDREDAALAFAECMREHGVDMPDPDFDDGEMRLRAGGDAEEVDPEVFDEANEACQEHLEGIAPELSEEDRETMLEAGLAFAQCMREHGIDMPDPEITADGGLRIGRRGGGGDEARFDEAQAACEDELPRRRRGGPAADGEAGDR